MSHPKDNQLYPIGTKAIWTRPSHRVKDKEVEVVIRNHCFQFDGKGFLNYEVEMAIEPGNLYAAFHDDLDPVDI
jgi:hypothetical protein